MNVDEKYEAVVSQRGFKNHPIYSVNDDPKYKLWRYMDLAKFVSLISTQTLFFPKCTSFEDVFEGSVSEENVRQRPQNIENIVKSFLKMHIESGADDVFDAEELRAHLKKSHEVKSQKLRWERDWTYVLCWHENKDQSAAMWKLYSKSDEAVAIQTTAKKLIASLYDDLINNNDMWIGKVKYTDYKTDLVTRDFVCSEFFHKRISFCHENEFRVVIQYLPKVPYQVDQNGEVVSWKYDYQRTPIPGKALKVDLNLLIENIYVSPTAPSWFTNVVESVVKQWGYNNENARVIPVIQSDLYKGPIY